MAALTFTDTIGAAELRSPLPTFGQRFLSFLPDVDPVGPSEVAPATGYTYRWEFRVDQLATMVIQGLKWNQHAVALRLKRHMMNGGAVSVATEDASSNVYAVHMAPGSLPTLSGPDPRSREYTFTVSVMNDNPAVPLICEY